MMQYDDAVTSNAIPDGRFSIQVTGAGHRPHGMPARRLSLICEGGGQRGIFTAGILDCFLQQHYFPFHALFGVSAGAQNLSSYACGQQGYARDAIMQYTTSRKFYDPVRFARGGHLIDLDWYFDALNQDMPLHVEHGLHRLAGRSFHICASRRETLEPEYLSFHSGNVMLAMKASCAIPLFYRHPVQLDGVAYWDGGLTDSLPVSQAHNMGSDCMVVIRSQPRDSVNAMALLHRNWHLKGLQKMGSLADRYVKNYRAALQFIDTPPAGLTVIDVAPVKPLKSRLLGSPRQALLHDYHLGQRCASHFLEHHAWRL